MPTKTAKKPTKKAATPKADVYQIVTAKVLAMLAAGTVPWRQPWAATGMPMSMSTRKPYRGINPFLLLCSSLSAGYNSPYWGTYEHITKLGGQVRKGQESTMIVWWNRGSRVVDDEATGEKVTKAWVTLRLFRVFNADQADGLPERFMGITESGLVTVDDVDALTALYESTLASLGYGGDRAFYSKVKDHVQLPPIGSYTDIGEFYSTKFHELGHSTGHKTRLDRPGIVEGHRLGDEMHAAEELIAEMTAAMLCGIAGIEQSSLANSAAYLAHWMTALQGDSKLIVTAAAAAQKAADLILGTTFGNDADVVA